MTTRLTLCVLALGLRCLTSPAREYEGSRENSILLNGPWEFAVGDGTEAAETAEGQGKLRWQQVQLPGPFMAWRQCDGNRRRPSSAADIGLAQGSRRAH